MIRERQDETPAKRLRSDYFRQRRRTHLPPEIRLRRITHVEGNKLTVDFDKAGEKKVIDAYVTKA
jgi:hypothetical protein